MSKKLKVNKNNSFKSIVDKIGINEKFTKISRKPKHFNKFINGIVPVANFNYMSDLIELPTTDDGYKWLLVVLDLATNKFDIEEMKTKSAVATLEAFKKIIRRKILKLPEISLKSDGGTEFKGQFSKFLTDHKIMHKISIAGRKTQMAPVESLNNTLGRLLMNYLNEKTVEDDRDYFNWTDILPIIREELNQYRERNLDALKDYQDTHFYDPDVAGDPEFKVGDYVNYKLEVPVDIRGHKVEDQTRWRQADRRYSVDTKQIVDILYYPDAPYYRYKLFGMPHVSYSATELMLSDESDNKHIVKKIVGKRTVNKQKQFLVWWKGELKDQATWELESQLLEDNLEDYIKAFEKEERDKTKAKKK
jgi:hypothetical protein